jgi:hypothetical protein
MIPIRSLLPVFAALVASGCAQSTNAPSPVVTSTTGDTIYPGDARIDGRVLTRSTEQITMTMERTGQLSRTMGSATDQLATADLGGISALLRVNTVQQGTATLIDSTWSDPRTLEPKRHRSVQPGRRLLVDWSGRAIAARIEPKSGTPVVKDSTFRVPSFDSSNWELLVRAMDLGLGVTRVLPVYDVDGLLQYYVARVSDTTRVEGRPAWLVKTELGRAGVATLTIEQATRRLALVQVPFGQATLRMAPAAR